MSILISVTKDITYETRLEPVQSVTIADTRCALFVEQRLQDTPPELKKYTQAKCNRNHAGRIVS
eukprot:scaffold38565_cov61-Attheya_sp.AAC.2